jgi:EAL domain-containing protein (putative c-di-GMP-specific phosphodiesterase class I)
VIGQIIDELKVDSACLELEITESMIMENLKTPVMAVQGLYDIVLSLSIYGLGTRHLPQAYLKLFYDG